MFKIKLTCNDGSPVTLYLTGKSNLAVCTDRGQTYVLDGLQLNGGWKVKETPAEVEAKLVAVGLCLADEATDTAVLELSTLDAEG